MGISLPGTGTLAWGNVMGMGGGRQGPFLFREIFRVGLGLPVAMFNNEGRVKSYKVFIEKVSQPRRQGAYKHSFLSYSKLQGSGL